jgi:acyl-CoA thioester hydrolase
MPAVYQHRLTVRDEELDPLGHVNNARYLVWMQDAAVAHSAAQGWDGARYESIGAAWFVRSHAIEYLQPARRGDEIVVHTWVADLKKVRSLRKYRIERAEGGVLLARAETVWVFVDREQGTPKRPPAELLSAFDIVAEA